MEGRYYQFVGRIREWIGTVAHNEVEADLGRHDRLVGRISEHCHVPLEEAELLASKSEPFSANRKDCRNEVLEQFHFIEQSDRAKTLSQSLCFLVDCNGNGNQT
jgi:uncharacterized protein YjbJ (UPF0337 family)